MAACLRNDWCNLILQYQSRLYFLLNRMPAPQSCGTGSSHTLTDIRCAAHELSTEHLPGVATAFAAPIGGLLFTVEEGASFYSTSIFWRGFLSTGMGVFTLHFLVEASQHPGNVLSAHFGRYRCDSFVRDILKMFSERYSGLRGLGTSWVQGDTATDDKLVTALWSQYV